MFIFDINLQHVRFIAGKAEAVISTSPSDTAASRGLLFGTTTEYLQTTFPLHMVLEGSQNISSAGTLLFAVQSIDFFFLYLILNNFE